MEFRGQGDSYRKLIFIFIFYVYLWETNIFIVFMFKHQVENEVGTKNVRIPHILHTLSNFIGFLEFDFFRPSFEHPLKNEPI